MDVFISTQGFSIQTSLLEISLHLEVFFETLHFLFFLLCCGIYGFWAIPYLFEASSVESKLAHNFSFEAAIHAEFLIVNINFFLLVSAYNLGKLIKQEILFGLSLMPLHGGHWLDINKWWRRAHRGQL